ncbi:MAG: ABC transporter ATP-binding protein [Archangium gephyra]|uniref:ABC transporter ATP-binding protein n=1 Tax=Archangium gephyra TaxID=48 RepID=A0A2W5TPP3_9BACT|nr:MAG: ABC transporter ATP-binding protein [Archangium gephyra]
MSTVELTNLHKSWGTTQVVTGVSLHVASGEFISLLGPSGCGKTTTLRMIAGLEHPDSGSISIGGVNVDDTPPEKRNLGMVFQSYAVWPHRTVEENVAYPLVLQRRAKTEIAERVNQALGWVRLTPFASRMPSQLSGGQLQRVAIARALVAQPQVLLLDEPLSNLDAALREELRGEIAALRTRLGTTMIFVTHDQHEALALADRVAVMNRGVIEQIDSPRRIYQAPSTPFVAGFVGSANVLAGRVEQNHFVVGEARFPLTANEGPATIAVRAEDLVLGSEGPKLTLLAKLFLGSATEYRLALGEHVLRAVGPHLDVKPGDTVPVTFRDSRLFPGTRQSV